MRGQSDDPVLREAAQWLARADLGTIDQEAFERWRADPRHALAFVRVADAGQRSARAGASPALKARRVGAGVTRRAAMIAGLGTLSLGGGALLAERVYARDRVSTSVGGRRDVDLARTGTLILNTDTVASWRADRLGLRLWLERGEIALDLADEALPVRLHAGNTGARLAPGRYNARLRDALLDLTVVRGEAFPEAPGAASISGPHVAVLTPERALVRTASSEELAAMGAWRSGELLFVDSPLAKAVEEYNRYLTRRMAIADPALGSIRVGGRFTATDPSAFLRALELTRGIEVTLSSHSVVLSQKES